MIIHIRFGYDLPTRAQNELRYRLEMERWKRAWRDAESSSDYDQMDRLQIEYERVGLP